MTTLTQSGRSSRTVIVCHFPAPSSFGQQSKRNPPTIFTFATMVASAVFITDLQGKAIISRNYRGDVPMTKSIERFAKYLVEIEEEAKKPIFHVDSNGDVETGDDVGASGPGGETYVYVSVSTESTKTGVGRNPFSLLVPPLGCEKTHILNLDLLGSYFLFSIFSIPTCICVR
jgi:hypothetical protein